eukprot:scaffold43714_cov62-Cyclotella_meneghiniana.AAC.1
MSLTPPDQTFDKILVNAPPGKLGIHMVDLDSGGSKVSAVNNDSVLARRVLPGDVLAKINEVDCSEMNTTDILNVFSRQANVVKMIEFHRAKALDDVDNATMPSKKDRNHKHHKHHNGHRKKKHQVHDFNGTHQGGTAEGDNSSVEGEFLADAVLVEQPEIYDAECVTGEQSQSSMKQHITINMPPTSSSNGQETHVKDSSRFWQSRWFLILLIVVVLCAIGGSVAGVIVYLGGKPEDDSSITTSINTPITVDVSSIQNEINGGPVLSSFHVIMLTSDASNGTCLVDENFDSITYVPDKGFTGTDHCDYMICDLVDCIEDTLEVDVMQDITSEPPMDVISTTVAPEQHIETESTLPSTIAPPVTTSSSTTTSAPTKPSEPHVDFIPTTVTPEENIESESTIPPVTTSDPTKAPVTTPAPTKATTTDSPTVSSVAPVDTSLFYVDWNEGLFGMCVKNCEGQPPCGGISTRQGEKFFATALQCCEEQLPNEPLSDCTNADISHIAVDSNIPSTDPTNSPTVNPTNNPTNNSTINPTTPDQITYPTKNPVTVPSNNEKWSNRKELSWPTAQDDDTKDQSGAAYIVQKNEVTGEWKEIQKLSANDAEYDVHFGWSVAVSEDVVVVGSHSEVEKTGNYSGDFYVFEYNGPIGKWEEVARLTANDGTEGDFMYMKFVAMSKGIIVIGSYHNNFVYVFQKNKNTGNWEDKQIPHFDEWTRCWSVGVSGNVIAVGVQEDIEYGIDTRAVYVYELDESSGAWIRVSRLTVDDTEDGTDNEDFGYSVGVSGRTIVIGSPNENTDKNGAAYIFEKNESSGKWVEIKRLDCPDKIEYGWSFGFAVGVFEDIIVIGNTADKKSYVYQRVRPYAMKSEVMYIPDDADDFLRTSPLFFG